MSEQAARDRDTLRNIHQTINAGWNITDERVNILKAVADAAAASLRTPFKLKEFQDATKSLEDLATRLKQSAPN